MVHYYNIEFQETLKIASGIIFVCHNNTKVHGTI